MIICHVRHGRTRRDAHYLAQHLMKCDAAPAMLHAVKGLAATDLAGALHAMRRLAPAGRAAFHHVSLSPAGDWTAEALAGAASRVVRELGGDPANHPHALVMHRKPSPSGRGPLHAHVVIAHWTGTGPGLRDAWTKVRLERLARELEWDAGEALTRGRHDRAVAKALRARGRADIADALLTAESGGEAPRSPIMQAARQALTRKGIDDVAARRTVVSAWTGSDTPGRLRAALGSEGLRLEPGKKPGVWLVMTDADVVIGALDRIAKQRRAEVATFMENDLDDRITIERVDPTSPKDRPQDGTPPPPARFARRTGRAKPDRPDPRSLDGHPGGAAQHQRQPTSDRAGNPAPGRHRVRERAAAASLASAISIPDIKKEAERRYIQRRLDELRQAYGAAREKLALAKAPLPIPDSLIQARLRADRARQASKVTREAMRAANARIDAIQAIAPRGLALIVSWIGGRAQKLRQEAAEAAEAARRASDRYEYAERLASVFQAALEAEADRSASERVQATAVRRQLAEVAKHELTVAAKAARMLRNDPSLASCSIRMLMERAEQEIRQQLLAKEPDSGPAPVYGR